MGIVSCTRHGRVWSAWIILRHARDIRKTAVVDII